MLILRRIIVTAALALLAGSGIAAADGPVRSVVAITVDGASQNVLLVMPSGPPKAAVVMFPGGDGVIGVRNDGSILRPGNFLIRTQPEWLAQGFMFVAVDAAPALVGQRGDRVGPQNLRAIAEIVAAVRQRTPAPIWLLGTSAGAPARWRAPRPCQRAASPASSSARRSLSRADTTRCSTWTSRGSACRC